MSIVQKIKEAISASERKGHVEEGGAAAGITGKDSRSSANWAVTPSLTRFPISASREVAPAGDFCEAVWVNLADLQW